MSRPIPAPQQFYNNGVPVAGGKLFSFAAGTNTPLVTYTDESGGTPNANPTILDSQGKASIWIPQTTGYKFQLQDSLGNVLWTVDQVFLIDNGSITATEIAFGAVGTNQLAANPISTAKIALAAITTALMAAGIVTTSKFANGAVTINKLQNSIDLTTLTNMAEAPPFRGNSKLWLAPQYPWLTPSILTAPTTLPTGQPSKAKWSPDGYFLAVSHATTPFISIYERTGNTLTKLANPLTLPAGAATSVAWNMDGSLLVVGHATTPFITIYQRAGNTFTKLTNPSPLPGHNVNDVAFSPNGEMLLIAMVGGMFLYQVAGTTFTDITTASGIGSIPGFSTPTNVCWSPDGQYVALPQASNPSFVQFAIHAGSKFYPILLKGLFGRAIGPCAWSPDGQYLAFTQPTNGSVGASVLKFSGAPVINYGAGTASGINATTISLGTVNECNDVAWSPDGQFLAFVSPNSPFLLVYQRVGDVFTLLTNVGTLPASAAFGVCFSPSAQFLSVAGGATPYVNTYKTTGAIPSPSTVYGRNFINV